MVSMFAVLFFAAGPVRPAGSRGNDDTREEAAGKTRACQIRRGRSPVMKLVFGAGGFPRRRPPSGKAGKPVFPELGTKYKIGENNSFRSVANPVVENGGEPGFPRVAL